MIFIWLEKTSTKFLLVFHFFYFVLFSFFLLCCCHTNESLHPLINFSYPHPHFLATQLYSLPEFDFLFSSTLKVIWWWIWWYSFIFLCLAYLSIIRSKFTHAVTNDRIFFFIKSIPISFHIFYICSSLGEHLPVSMSWLLWTMLQWTCKYR